MGKQASLHGGKAPGIYVLKSRTSMPFAARRPEDLYLEYYCGVIPPSQVQSGISSFGNSGHVSKVDILRGE